jgi:hypothetical protein
MRKQEGLRLIWRQLGHEIVARSGEQLSWRLVHDELDDHMLSRVRRLLTVELGRQRPEIANVLALESTLQLGFVGGRSPGLAPLRILSTYAARRCPRSEGLDP